MELYQLRAFDVVADEGNMTRAAERLFASQPAVSQQIKALEQELGLVLFDRTPKGMRLTPAGQQLRESARRVLHEAKRLRQEAVRIGQTAVGTLRLGFAHIGSAFSFDRLAEALLSKDELLLECHHGVSGVLRRALLDLDIDAALLEGHVEGDDLEVLQVATTQLKIVVPTAWADELPAGDWSALEQKPWVFSSPDCSYHRELARLCAVHDLELRRQFRSDFDGSTLLFVRQGRAVSLVDRTHAEQAAAQGHVAIWEGYEGSLPVIAAACRSRLAEPPIRAFFAACRKLSAFSPGQAINSQRLNGTRLNGKKRMVGA